MIDRTLTPRECWALVCAFDWALQRLFYRADDGRRQSGCAAIAVRRSQVQFYDAAQALGDRGLGDLMAKVSAMASEASAAMVVATQPERRVV